MTQFASTLYPQTNPTNPILLGFRSCASESRFTTARVAAHWTKSRANWNVVTSDQGATPGQRTHAHRVLTRLANFIG